MSWLHGRWSRVVAGLETFLVPGGRVATREVIMSTGQGARGTHPRHQGPCNQPFSQFHLTDMCITFAEEVLPLRHRGALGLRGKV